MASPNFSLVEFFKKLYYKREESSTTDFTVVCQDDSEIPVHSVVLIAWSDVLEMTMTADFKESHEKKIHLRTYSTKTVQQFIRFLYGFELEQNDLQLAKDMTIMGGIYNIPTLQKAAAKALVQHSKIDKHNRDTGLRQELFWNRCCRCSLLPACQGRTSPIDSAVFRRGSCCVGKILLRPVHVHRGVQLGPGVPKKTRSN